MTTRLAILLVVAIAALLAADLLHFGWDIHVLLGRTLIDLTERMAFWR